MEAFKIRVTGERVIPKYNKLPELNNIYQKHMARYLFVSKFVENKFVLDAGCGCGYGSDYLAEHAKKVVGIDSSDEAIKYSKEHYAKNNLEFQVMDCTNFSTS